MSPAPGKEWHVPLTQAEWQYLNRMSAETRQLLRFIVHTSPIVLVVRDESDRWAIEALHRMRGTVQL